jgi:hypothetical protein
MNFSRVCFFFLIPYCRGIIFSLKYCNYRFVFLESSSSYAISHYTMPYKQSLGIIMRVTKSFFIFLIMGIASFSVWFITFFTSCHQKDVVQNVVYPLDTLMGDWQGRMVTVDGIEQQLAAQVICYAHGQYQANLLDSFDCRDSALVIMKGHKKDSAVYFKGSKKSTEWQGTLKGKSFTGNMSGQQNGQFTLSKIIRLSPTLNKKPPSQAILLFDGTDLHQWQQVADPVGYINLARYIGGNDCAAYLKTSLWSDVDQTVMMLLGSDDGVKVWLNDNLIWVNSKNRSAEPDDDTVKVALLSGWNTILCKIANGDGGWGMYMKFVNQNGLALTNIYEKIPAAAGGKSVETLIQHDNYLTTWWIAGPFKQKDVYGNQLLDVVFPPEQQQGNWKELNMAAADYSARWKIINGAMEVLPGSGSIISKEKFKDFDLHIEFRLPFMPDQTGQKRGNSGVYMQGRYEVQVLDSYGLSGEDNECGGIYKVARPRVNMCAPPGQWQTYDVTFKAAQFDAAGNKIKPAQITVLHNGVPIHENLFIPAPTGGAIDLKENETGGLMLQDHGDLVQYRNIWIVGKKD